MRKFMAMLGLLITVPSGCHRPFLVDTNVNVDGDLGTKVSGEVTTHVDGRLDTTVTGKLDTNVAGKLDTHVDGHLNTTLSGQVATRVEGHLETTSRVVAETANARPGMASRAACMSVFLPLPVGPTTRM